LSGASADDREYWDSIPADAGATVYECPQHFNCDGGCGYVYNEGDKP
jgi:hypothetical protein